MEEEQQEHEKVKLIIENPERSHQDERELMKYAIKGCQISEVRPWLDKNQLCFIKLVNLFQLMKEKIKEKSKEDKEKYKDIEVDIIFVAHGSIRDSQIPASCLLPGSNILDVLLYSPWNCLLSAPAAYGIATGRIQPEHRVFTCYPKNGCVIPNAGHQPTVLPPGWNSMKEEAGMIPNIMVSTLKKPEDGAWNGVQYLMRTSGKPRKYRIVIPFILPGETVVRIPFFIVTWVMSLVLSFFPIKATVHLAACLGDKSTEKFSRRFLECQYSYTIADTGMTSSPIMLKPPFDLDLYRNLQAVFD